MLHVVTNCNQGPLTYVHITHIGYVYARTHAHTHTREYTRTCTQMYIETRKKLNCSICSCHIAVSITCISVLNVYHLKYLKSEPTVSCAALFSGTLPEE